jgi:hypothetical protein
MIDRIDHIVMNCHDVEATASWYERALGSEREAYQSPAEPGQRLAVKFWRICQRGPAELADRMLREFAAMEKRDG